MAGSETRRPLWMPALAALAAVVVADPARGEAPARPNVLVIVADDLGFSDIGAFGGEIRTPNLDALAQRGVRFTGFHTAPTCSPTRAMLLTGADNHQVGLGSMAEMVANVPALQGRRGYEGHLNGRAVPLPKRMKAAGYMTVMSGKWHLGLTEETSPKAEGFDRSFAMLEGGHDHFGDDQLPPIGDTPAATSYREDGRRTSYPIGRYSADVFASRMIGYLGEARASGKPFFAYLTFTEPHWPIQAPDEDIARYKGRYAEGYEALRLKRLKRLQDLGLIAGDVQPSPLVGVKPWAELTAEEKAVASRKMEVYAAMVDRMDQNIGRVMAALERNGQLDNTVILFFSDNGAEGTPLEGPYGLSPAAVAALGYDNRLENIGRRRSYTSYGQGWAQAATAPSRNVKGTAFEGGIRTPMIVAGPGVKGAGRISHAPLHVIDITPTVLAITDVSEEASKAELPIQGRSLTPLLTDEAQAIRPADEPMAWELFFQRAVRVGDFKAVYAPVGPANPYAPGAAPSQWRLFNLKDDPGETRDLAAEQPERLQMLVAAWDAYAARTGVVVPQPAAAAPPVPTH